jgi:pyruvate, water dikinase
MDENKNADSKPINRKLWFLNERAKELNCLYKVEEVLKNPDTNLEGICRGLIEALPAGWQHPELCQVKIVIEDCVYQSHDFKGSQWFQRAEIRVLERLVGSLSVYYTKETPHEGNGPFLDEERKLITTIAERLGNFITYQKMRNFYHDQKTIIPEREEEQKPDWKILLELLRKTDRILFFHISHKMLNHLCWTGVEEAQKLVQYYDPDQRPADGESIIEGNRPFKKKAPLTSNDFLSDETFKIAADHLTPSEIISFIKRWIQQDKLSFLMKTLGNLHMPISEVAEAIRRYQRMAPDGIDIASATKNGALVSLIRRFFSEQLEFINIAKNYIEVGDFFDLLQNVIFFPESNGKLGGKSEIGRASCRERV